MNTSTIRNIIGAAVVVATLPFTASGRATTSTDRTTPVDFVAEADELAGKAPIKFSVQVNAKKKGAVLCALYDDEDTWLSEKVYRRAKTSVDGGWVTCVFPAIDKRGKYAIAALHDEDGDGEMDKILGIPQEGYSMSRDAHTKSLVPKWDNAVFTFSGEEVEQVGHMKY
ncbi:MAG: DUF2141 domain-containing protein [Polyangiaceae bacterium]|nr:DUF2141 domain-containing protein [Polyangiaceae bacterium]